MRPLGSVFLALAIAGCGGHASDGTPIVTDGSFVGTVTELASPGSTYKARQSYDDRKCRDYGFKPGTESYSNCRLRLDEARANIIASTPGPAPPARPVTCTHHGNISTCH